MILFSANAGVVSSSIVESKAEKKEARRKFTINDYFVPNERELTVYKTVWKLGYSDFMARMIVIQARHESGEFNSKLYRTATNAFGMMKHPKDTLMKKENYWAEGRCCYAGYETLEHSTLAAMAWLTRKGCPFDFKTTKQYATWLKSKNYYECKIDEYLPGLDRHYKELTLPDSATLVSFFTPPRDPFFNY